PEDVGAAAPAAAPRYRSAPGRHPWRCQLAGELGRKARLKEFSAMRVVDYYWDHPDLKPYEKRFREGTVLFHQGEEGNAMYVIQRGAVELVVEPRGGKPLPVAVEDAGKFVGEKAIVSHEKYRRVFGARALTDLVCLVLTRRDVDELEAKNLELTK